MVYIQQNRAGADVRPVERERIRCHLDSPRFSLLTIRCEPCPAEQAVVPDPTLMRRPTFGFVRRGLGILSSAGVRLRADPTRVVTFNAGVGYHVRHVGCAGRDCAVCLGVAPELLAESMAEHGIDARGEAPFPRPMDLIPQTPATSLLLHQVLAEADGEPGWTMRDEVEELCLLLLGSALETLERMGPDRYEPSSAAVRCAREVLVRRYTEQLTLDELAAQAGCSKYHLCRAFRVQTGMTISRFRHRLRINDAMSRILEGEDGLTQLGHDLGFSSHSHFTTVFRRLMGITPKRFRECVAQPFDCQPPAPGVPGARLH